MPALVSSHMHDRFHVQASCSSLSLVFPVWSSKCCLSFLLPLFWITQRDPKQSFGFHASALGFTRVHLHTVCQPRLWQDDTTSWWLLLWLLQADFSAYISFYTSLSRIIKCYKYFFLLTWATQTVETLQPLFIHLYEGAAPDTSLRVKPKIFWFLLWNFAETEKDDTIGSCLWGTTDVAVL